MASILKITEQFEVTVLHSPTCTSVSPKVRLDKINPCKIIVIVNMMESTVD